MEVARGRSACPGWAVREYTYRDYSSLVSYLRTATGPLRTDDLFLRSSLHTSRYRLVRW